MGQGATMALPIFAYYMQKIYADELLDYSQEEKFDIPLDFDPCSSGDDERDEDDGQPVTESSDVEQRIYE
jgi:penicillin-binding protein 1A